MGTVAGRKEGTLWLGTQSWSHESWRGVFYSEAAEASAFIREYAEQFPVVEIDSTWYRIPTPYQIAHWHDQTPERFLFTAKVPRIITHEKVLSDCQDELTAFLRVMDGLGEKLGPLLFQFPYFNKNAFSSPDPFFDRLAGFLASLPEGYRFAVEIRNKHWLLPRLIDLLRESGVAYCLIDHVWMPRIEQLTEKLDVVTSDFCYVRWLGDRSGIEKKTKTWGTLIEDKTKEMKGCIEPLQNILRMGIPIFGFFNNHYAGHAPASVRAFQALWEE